MAVYIHKTRNQFVSVCVYHCLIAYFCFRCHDLMIFYKNIFYLKCSVFTKNGCTFNDHLDHSLLSAQGQCFFICNYDHIVVKLQYRSRYARYDRSEEGFINCLCFVLSACQQQNFLG